MKTTVLLIGTLLFFSCRLPKTSVTDKIIHKDSLTINGKIYYLDSISKSTFQHVKNVLITKKPDTSILMIQKESLVIKANDRIVVFKNDTTESEHSAFYNYKSFLPESGYIHIEGIHWEWTSDCFVNLKNGSETYFWDNPIISPNNKLLISYSYDLVAGFMVNGIQLYRIDTDTISNIFEIEIANWGPEEIKWDTDTSIVIKRAVLDQNMEASNDYLRMIIN